MDLKFASNLCGNVIICGIIANSSSWCSSDLPCIKCRLTNIDLFTNANLTIYDRNSTQIVPHTICHSVDDSDWQLDSKENDENLFDVTATSNHYPYITIMPSTEKKAITMSIDTKVLFLFVNPLENRTISLWVTFSLIEKFIQYDSV